MDKDNINSTQKNITDKELLAICNLSNLKLEFAEITKKSQIIEKGILKEVVTNHTIYSLLDKEIKSIKNDVGNISDTRAFYREREGEDKNKPVLEAVYNSIDELKYKSGIIYEYYEKYRLGNDEGKFLEEWELLYGGDGYKISTDFSDFIFEIEAKIKLERKAVTEFIDQDGYYERYELGKINEDGIEKYKVEKFDINNKKLEITEEEEEEFITNELENIYNLKVSYQPREVYERMHLINERIEIGLTALYWISIFLPLALQGNTALKKSQISEAVNGIKNCKQSLARNGVNQSSKIAEKLSKHYDEIIKGLKNSATEDVKKKMVLLRKEYKTILQNELKMKSSKAKEEKIKQLLKAMDKNNKEILEGSTRIIGQSFLKFQISDPLVNSVKGTLKNGKYIKKNEKTIIINLVKDYIKSSIDDVDAAAGEIVKIVKKAVSGRMNELLENAVTKENIITLFNERAVVTFYILDLSLKEIKENYKHKINNIEEKKKLEDLINKLENTQKELINCQFKQELKFDDFEFGVTILKNDNKKAIVICFKNSDFNSKISKRLITGDYHSDLIFMNIIEKYILEKIYLTNTKLRDYEVIVTGFNIGAELAGMFRLRYNHSTRVFKTRSLAIEPELLAFNVFDIGHIFKKKYVTFEKDISDFCKSFFKDNIIPFILSWVFTGGSSILTVAAFSALTASISIIENMINKEKIDKLYLKMCKIGLFSCEQREQCNYIKNSCKYLKEEIRSPDIVENAAEILQEKIEINLNYSRLRFNEKTLKEILPETNPIKIKIKKIDYITLMSELSLENSIEDETVYIVKNESDIKNKIFRTIKTPEKTTKDQYNANLFKRFFNKELEIGMKYDLKESYSFKIIEKDGEYSLEKEGHFRAEVYKQELVLSGYETTRKWKKVEVTHNITKKVPMTSDILSWYLFEHIEMQKTYKKNNNNLYRAYNAAGIKIHLLKDIEGEEERKKYENEKFYTILENNEFIFFPLIDFKSGNILYENTDNGKKYIVKCNAVNDNYIGSFFRSYMEDYVNSRDIIPKKDAYDDTLKETDEKSYYEKMINGHSFSLQSGKEKKYINADFLSYILDKETTLEIMEDNGARGFYLLHNLIVEKLEDNPDILNKFYIIKNGEIETEKIIKIGHLLGEEYNQKAIEYLYNYDSKYKAKGKNNLPFDRIRRGILTLNVKVPKEGKGLEDLAADKIIMTTGNKLACTMSGDSTTIFKATKNGWVKGKGKTIGTSSDKIVGTNITPFAKCTKTKSGKCECMIVGEWSNTSETNKIAGERLLTNKSTIKCVKSGTIFVKNSEWEDLMTK